MTTIVTVPSRLVVRRPATSRVRRWEYAAQPPAIRVSPSIVSYIDGRVQPVTLDPALLAL